MVLTVNAQLSAVITRCMHAISIDFQARALFSLLLGLTFSWSFMSRFFAMLRANNY